MGGLLKEVQAASKKTRVEELVVELGAEGAELVEALRDPSIQIAAIRQALKKRGHSVAASTLSLWRRDHGIA